MKTSLPFAHHFTGRSTAPEKHGDEDAGKKPCQYAGKILPRSHSYLITGNVWRPRGRRYKVSFVGALEGRTMTREEWEKVVNHIVYKEEDSMVVLDARKKLFMRLYDDYVHDKKEKEINNNERV